VPSRRDAPASAKADYSTAGRGGGLTSGAGWAKIRAMAAIPARIVLRPWEIKHLFDFAIRLYRLNFVPMFLAMAMVQLPLSLIGLPFWLQLSGLGFDVQEWQARGEMPGPDFWYAHSDLLWWLIVMIPGALAYQLLVMPLGNLTCAKLGTQSLLGEQWSFGQAFRFALTRYWPTQVALATFFLPLVVVSVFVLLPVLGAQLAGSSVGVISTALFALFMIMLAGAATSLMWFRFFPALFGIVQCSEPPEGPGIFAQGVWYLKRSYGLTQGYFWRLLGLLLLLYFAINMVQQGFNNTVNLVVSLAQAGMAGQTMGEGLISAMEAQDPLAYALILVLGILVSLVFLPVVLSFQVLLYFDLRCRKEGFDLLHYLRGEQAS